MKKITSQAELKEAIRLLEVDRANKLELLKADANTVIDSLKPENLIKNTLQHALGSVNIKESLINGIISLVGGYLSKKVLTGGGEHNPVKNILGNIIQFGMASLVSKNVDEVKSTGRSLLKSIFSKKQE